MACPISQRAPASCGVCMIDLARYPDPRAALETALGKMVLFEVLTVPEPAGVAAE